MSALGSASASRRRIKFEAADARIARDHALFGVVPLLVTAFFVYWIYAAGRQGIDFRHEYWVAGRRLLHGVGLYHWTYGQIIGGVAFPYPALTALVFVPFALIPLGLATALFTVVCLAAAWATLRVLGVRDWRIYGIVLAWAPVIEGWQTGNLTLLLGLGIALIWRYRDRPFVAGCLTAFFISLKTFMWPIALWLLVTRRYRAFVHLVLAALLLNAAAWLTVGTDEISAFLALSSHVTALLHDRSYGVPAVVADLGFGRSLGTGVEVALSLAAAAACLWGGRRRNDVQALTCAIALMLLASPLVWPHYFALIMIPIAIARPRLSWPWVLPVIIFLCPANGAGMAQVILIWVVAAVCMADVLGIGSGTVALVRRRQAVLRASVNP